MLDEEIAWHERKKSYRRVAFGILISLIATAAAIVLITNLWLAVLQVDGSSMNPLLQMDEIVFAVRTDNPARGEVVALYYNNRLQIKRVIGIAGDTVNISSDGAVSVNGNRISEPYVAEKSLGTCDIEFPFQVPTGTVFVLGDNRADSMDSRDGRFGPVPREQIVGRIAYRAWPLREAGKVS